MLIQSECAVVRLLGVDRRCSRMATHEPGQRVRDELRRDACSLSIRVDRQSLEVALVAGETSDRIRHEVGHEHTHDSCRRRGLNRLDEVGLIKFPERIERPLIDLEQPAVMPPVDAAELGRALIGCRDVREVVLKKVESFVHREPGVTEEDLFRLAERGRQYFLVSTPCESRHGPLEACSGQVLRCGKGGEIAKRFLASPRTDAIVLGTERHQRKFAHARNSATRRLMRDPTVRCRAVTLLYVTHPDCLVHDPGPAHPERRERLAAARDGLIDSGVPVEIITSEPVAIVDVKRVHDGAVVRRLEAIDAQGGGAIDPDTAMSAGSRRAADLAAGSGLTAVRYIDLGEATRAFCAIRPPGHHATPHRSMGFCLLNSVAITAAALRDRGERVAIVDLDAHHGNGTQDAFYGDPRVLFASLHQSPFYPGTGALAETGAGEASGTTINIPVPAGTTGDAYRAAIELVIGPALQRFAPTWLLLSIGYDAHRDDPLTALSLTSGDYGDLVARLVDVAPTAKVVALLEGGYDLAAVRNGVHATLTALAGAAAQPEPLSRGSYGREAVEAAARLHRQASS